MRQGAVACGLLLELPSRELEDAFWQDDVTIRSYMHWDCIALLYSAVGGASLLRSLWPDLSSAAPADYTWAPLVLTTINLIACAATAAVLVLRPGLYKQHRHSLAVANRLLRTALAAGEALQGSPWLRQVIRTRSRPAPLTALGLLEHRSTAWHSMQMHLLKPLYVMSAVVMTSNNWVFRAKHYLLLSLLTHIMSCFRNQITPCLLAGDPFSAPLLQSSCSGMTQLYTVSALGTVLGSSVAADAMSSTISSTACQDAISAARMLVWFRITASDIISAAGFLLLEWRLKAAFVQRCTGKLLVYGPFRWGQSNAQTETGVSSMRASSLQFVLSWLLVVPCLLALLWGVALVLVPRLPKTECSFVEGYSSSNATLSQYCDAPWCANAGFVAALQMTAVILWTCAAHVGILRMV